MARSVIRRTEMFEATLKLGGKPIELSDYVTTGLLAVAVGPRGMGKCHIGSDTVLAADGRMVSFADMPTLTIASLDDNLKSVVTTGKAVEAFGLHRCYKVKTHSGYEVTVNGEHPLLRVEGWTATRDLKVGQHIATVRNCNVQGQELLINGLPTFIGLMIGDGGCSQERGNPRFSSRDPELRKQLLAFAKDRNWEIIAVGEDVRITSGKTSSHRGQKGTFIRVQEGPLECLRQLGLLGHTSHTKRVPTAIFTSPNEQVAEFIAAYFACDGTVNRRQTTVEFSSVNRDLLMDVKHLLLRFEIVGVIAQKRGRYNGAPHFSWRLTISGDFARKFAKRIPVRGEKSGLLDSFTQTKIKSNTNLDIIPSAWMKLLKHGEKWHRNRGLRWQPYNVYGNSRETVARVAANESNDELLKLSNSDVYWDRIVTIEDAGDQHVFNVEVPNTKVLIANGGVVSHNTNAGLVVGEQLSEQGWVSVLIDPEGEMESMYGDAVESHEELLKLLETRERSIIVVAAKDAAEFIPFGTAILEAAEEHRKPIFVMIDEGQLFSASKKKDIAEAADIINQIAERGRKRALDLFITALRYTGSLHRTIFANKNLTLVGCQEDPTAWAVLAPQFRASKIEYGDLNALSTGEFFCFSRRGVEKVKMPMAVALQKVAPKAVTPKRTLPTTFSQWNRAMREIPTARLNTLTDPVANLLGAVAGLSSQQMLSGTRALHDELEVRQ